ncbi:hypothetical protein BGZ58_007066 [Dissophora ornata]|nr:hypothetical protein BGZ58_007066 [Dissophora ornata]
MSSSEEKVDEDVGVTAHATYSDEGATKKDQGADAEIQDEEAEEEEEEEDPCLLQRWTFKRKSFTLMESTEQTETRMPPRGASTLKFERLLKMDDHKPGCYSVVLCVSIKRINIDALRAMVIDIRAVEKDGGALFTPENSSTVVVKKEEFMGFPTHEFTRLRLHYQIYHPTMHDQSLKIYLDFDDESVKSAKMKIHYVELHSNEFQPLTDTEDHVVYGEGRPDQIIHVGHANEHAGRSIFIREFGISDSGECAVTIYFDDGFAHVELWDLREPRASESASPPRIHHVPYARISFKALEPRLVDKRDFTIKTRISSSGSQVAICSTHDEPNTSIPFRVFKVALAAPAERDPSQLCQLEKVPTICDGLQFGFMSYHRPDPDSKNGDEEDEERFWTTQGNSFSAYSIKGRWNRICTICIQDQVESYAEWELCNSIQGRYFAWTGARGVISVWNFETGKLVFYMFTKNGVGLSSPSLSADGSIVAIPFKNTIQLYDTFTGMKIGIFKKGLDFSIKKDIVFGKDYFLTYKPDLSTPLAPKKHDTRIIVRVRDMSIVKSFYMHENYRSEYPQSGHDPIFAYRQGSTLNILKPGPILSPPPEENCDPDGKCERKLMDPIQIEPDCSHIFTSAAGATFRLSCTNSSYNHILSTVTSIQEDGVDGSDAEVGLPMRFNGYEHCFFIPATSQLVLIADGCLQLWTLHAGRQHPCELSLVWKFQDVPDPDEMPYGYNREILSAEICEHGKNIKITLSPTKWYDEWDRVGNYHEFEHQQGILTVPLSPEDTFSAPEEHRLHQGFSSLIYNFCHGNENLGKAIIRYLKMNLRPRSGSFVNPLVSLCASWTEGWEKIINIMMRQLLPTDRITWVPDVHATKDANPLAVILEKTRTHPAAFPIARLIIDYCVSHANRSRNLSFLTPFFTTLREIMDIYPDEAWIQLGRITFVPAVLRSFVMDNHIIVHEPRFRLKFWEPHTRLLSEVEDPILQLHVSSDVPEPVNDEFQLPIFMASFDAIWYYTEKKPLESSSSALADASAVTADPWWKTLLYMIRLNARLRSRSVVECYNFNLEFFDNPSIAALVAYKWNTIGFWYWFVRFSFQCCFYALVIIASIMQVYYPEPSKLVGIFIAIIVMAIVFLWLELQQAIHSWSQYKKSSYNLLDLLAFCLPLAASIKQLVIVYTNDINGNTRALSFSVLAVFLHMLFDLRINRSICKYVTIIEEAVVQIKSGIWDPISDGFSTDDWAFHIMMAMFFFFTVILMLNVLIALINVAFSKGDDSWRLIWIESRLRYIESAENLSYHIPGFRQSHNWFPSEIYFTATPKEIRAYREKYPDTSNTIEDFKLTEEYTRGPDDEDVDADEAGDEYDVVGSKNGQFDDDDEEDDEEEGDEEEGDDDKDDEEIEDGEGEQEEESDNLIESLEVPKLRDDGDGKSETNPELKHDEAIAIQNLSKQVENLQTQLAQQLTAQQDEVRQQVSQQLAMQQAQIQHQLATQQEQVQRQLEELKGLLLLRPTA